MEAIFQYASLGIVFTVNQVITRSNQAFGSMFGYEKGQSIGLKSSRLFESEADYLRFSAEVRPLLMRGSPIKVQTTFMRGRQADYLSGQRYGNQSFGRYGRNCLAV